MLGLLAATNGCGGYDREACGIALAFGVVAVGVGTLTGLIIDGAMNREDVVYQRPSVAAITLPRSDRWRWMPTVRRDFYGALFTLEFGR